MLPPASAGVQSPGRVSAEDHVGRCARACSHACVLATGVRCRGSATSDSIRRRGTRGTAATSPALLGNHCRTLVPVGDMLAAVCDTHSHSRVCEGGCAFRPRDCWTACSQGRMAACGRSNLSARARLRGTGPGASVCMCMRMHPWRESGARTMRCATQRTCVLMMTHFSFAHCSLCASARTCENVKRFFRQCGRFGHRLPNHSLGRALT